MFHLIKQFWQMITSSAVVMWTEVGQSTLVFHTWDWGVTWCDAAPVNDFFVSGYLVTPYTLQISLQSQTNNLKWWTKFVVSSPHVSVYMDYKVMIWNAMAVIMVDIIAIMTPWPFEVLDKTSYITIINKSKLKYAWRMILEFFYNYCRGSIIKCNKLLRAWWWTLAHWHCR